MIVIYALILINIKNKIKIKFNPKDEQLDNFLETIIFNMGIYI